MNRLKTDREVHRTVVLVAGMGSRLGAATRQSPKCLVEVNGVPILANALNWLADAGVPETMLVIGHLGDVIRTRIGDRWRSMTVSYKINTQYRTTGTTYSLWLAVQQFEGGMAVLEGDVFFAARVLDQLLAAAEPDLTLVERWTPALDGSVVEVAGDGTVAAWVHKKDRPPGIDLERTYKTVNMHRFSAEFVRDRLRPALAEHVAADGGREPIETVFAAMVRDGARIHAVEVSGPWAEIDDEHDLRTAEKMFQGAANEPR